MEQQRTTSRNRQLFAIIILLEILIVFAASAFGNKVADLLNISTGLIIIGTIFCLVLLYLITLARINVENNEPLLPDSLTNITPKRIVTLFPASILLGMFFAFIAITLLRSEAFFIPFIGRFWTYELLSYVLGALFLYRVSIFSQEFPTVLMCSVALALGIATVTLLMRSFDNSAFYTITYGLGVSILLAVITSSQIVHGLVSSVSQVIRGEG